MTNNSYDDSLSVTSDIMDKIIHVDDLSYILGNMYAKLNNKVMSMQQKEEKRGKIQSTGRLVYIVDRFVDIDFSSLKDAIPYVEDGDRLIILRDETRGDQCSVYSIYNTDSVPNIRYLGYDDPSVYPSCIAVQQYVANSVAMAERGLKMAFNDLRLDVSTKIQSLEDQIVNLTKSINELVEAETTRAKGVEESINNILSEHSTKISKCETDIEEIKSKP